MHQFHGDDPGARMHQSRRDPGTRLHDTHGDTVLPHAFPTRFATLAGVILADAWHLAVDPDTVFAIFARAALEMLTPRSVLLTNRQLGDRHAKLFGAVGKRAPSTARALVLVRPIAHHLSNITGAQ